MTLEEKYGIVYVDGKRYYKFDMAEKMPFLDDTVPYMFEYKNIKIKTNGKQCPFVFLYIICREKSPITKIASDLKGHSLFS